jgi:hypothetical protein
VPFSRSFTASATKTVGYNEPCTHRGYEEAVLYVQKTAAAVLALLINGTAIGLFYLRRR